MERTETATPKTMSLLEASLLQCQRQEYQYSDLELNKTYTCISKDYNGTIFFDMGCFKQSPSCDDLGIAEKEKLFNISNHWYCKKTVEKYDVACLQENNEWKLTIRSTKPKLEISEVILTY